MRNRKGKKSSKNYVKNSNFTNMKKKKKNYQNL